MYLHEKKHKVTIWSSPWGAALESKAKWRQLQLLNVVSFYLLFIISNNYKKPSQKGCCCTRRDLFFQNIFLRYCSGLSTWSSCRQAADRQQTGSNLLLEGRGRTPSSFSVTLMVDSQTLTYKKDAFRCVKVNLGFLVISQIIALSHTLLLRKVTTLLNFFCLSVCEKLKFKLFKDGSVTSCRFQPHTLVK